MMNTFNLEYAVLILYVTGGCFAQAENPRVQSDFGEIIGRTRTLTLNKEEYAVDSFLGIPYAQPPTGQLRFQKPLPLTKLTSPFTANKHGAGCFQTEVNILPSLSSMSEDCLFLNVYVPRGDSDVTSGFAVMVFIHGGGFQHGMSDTYGGSTLAAYGNVIVVTINYRLGIMGFLSTGDDLAPGNMGLWDQQLALQWVNNHIGSFGGDSGRVTVFGESAGSVSVIYQGMYPGNRGLIHRLIAESGTPGMKPLIKTNPLQNTHALAEFFNCSIDKTEDMITCLRSLDADKMFTEINAALSEDPTKAGLFLAFVPVVDRAFVKIDPSTFRETPERIKEELKFYHSLDLIIGVNNNEGVIGLPWVAGVMDMENFEPTREVMETQLIPGSVALALDGAGKGLVKSLISAEYTNWTNPDDPKTIRNEFVKLNGDSLFTARAVEYARLHLDETTKSKTFFYQFTANASKPLLPRPSWIYGANHGDELPYVFGYDYETIRELERLSTFEWQDPEYWEWETSYRMMHYWSTFAKTGSPNRLVGDDQGWPEYELQSQKALDIGIEDKIRKFIYARESYFWLKIIPEVIRIETEHAQTVSSADRDEGACYSDGDCDGI